MNWYAGCNYYTFPGGYAFGGRQTFRGKDSKITKDYDGGFFATIQAMYKF